jgi:hypothetical protein
MNTDPNSIYAPSGLARTLGATRLTEATGAARAKDIFGIAPGFLALTRSVFSVVAKIFAGIAEQRDHQAKQIIAYYGHDRWSDSLEREIGDAAFGKRTRL